MAFLRAQGFSRLRQEDVLNNSVLFFLCMDDEPWENQTTRRVRVRLQKLTKVCLGRAAPLFSVRSGWWDACLWTLIGRAAFIIGEYLIFEVIKSDLDPNLVEDVKHELFISSSQAPVSAKKLRWRRRRCWDPKAGLNVRSSHDMRCWDLRNPDLDPIWSCDFYICNPWISNPAPSFLKVVGRDGRSRTYICGSGSSI